MRFPSPRWAAPQLSSGGRGQQFQRGLGRTRAPWLWQLQHRHEKTGQHSFWGNVMGRGGSQTSHLCAHPHTHTHTHKYIYKFKEAMSFKSTATVTSYLLRTTTMCTVDRGSHSTPWLSGASMTSSFWPLSLLYPSHPLFKSPLNLPITKPALPLKSLIKTSQFWN